MNTVFEQLLLPSCSVDTQVAGLPTSFSKLWPVCDFLASSYLVRLSVLLDTHSVVVDIVVVLVVVVGVAMVVVVVMVVLW